MRAFSSGDGHYLLITAAGVMGEPGGGGYPKWLKPYLILLVSCVWSTMLIGSAVSDAVHVPNAVHVIMGVVVASLFRVEFGGIKLVNKTPEETNQ